MCDEDIIAGESDDAGECATERTVLELLIDKHCQRPWTLREIGLAIGSLGSLKTRSMSCALRALFTKPATGSFLPVALRSVTPRFKARERSGYELLRTRPPAETASA